jgi:predicted nucleic acid-binding protein
MRRVIVLDSGPLSLVTHPQGNQDALACQAWLATVAAAGDIVAIPEIADYEVRRELLRANKVQSIARLDTLIGRAYYLPITTAIMRRAADLWAQARQQGRQTARDAALDGDVILSAQALLLTHIDNDAVDEVVIATTNVRHITLFANAQLWQHIAP